MCHFESSVFSGESCHIRPELGPSRCNSVSCDLYGFLMFYLMVALFVKPRSRIFLHPYAFPVPRCRIPWPDPRNVDFTSVYGRFGGVVFCGFAVPETSRFCFATFLHLDHFGVTVSLRWEMTHWIKSISHVLPHGSYFAPTAAKSSCSPIRFSLVKLFISDACKWRLCNIRNWGIWKSMVCDLGI